MKQLDLSKPIVRYFNTRKNVTNLGWLLNKAYTGQFINVITVKDYIQPNNYECRLSVEFSDNYIFECNFASLSVLRDWLHRPTFYGVLIIWLGAPYFMDKVNPLPDVK